MGDRFSYTVQSGDTLTGIAQANGRQLGEVLALNHLSNPNAIREGQEIVIPADGVVPSDVSRRLEGGFYQWNARQEAIAANNFIGTDGMRIGPTIERAQAMGIYSGSQVQTAGMAYPDSPSMTAWDGVVRDSPAVAYLKSQSGGLDPVRAGSMDMQLVRGVGDTANPLYALAGGGYHIGQSIGAAINGDLGQAGLLFAVGAIEVRGAKFDAGGAVENNAKWTPHPEFQMPAADKGRFVGDIGNSPFALSGDAATAMGVPHGAVVPWREGIPDFGNYTVPGPGNIPGTFNVPGLVGDHAVDRALMLQQMATETGMSQRAIQRWLSTNDVRLHHAGGDAVQIVPTDIHSLHHSGGAQQLRGGN